ncbi:MAG: hypothetical protein M3320_01175 [Actinomycetota bacterium]|nr:hypothetical protein [Actinomycetota bacterium]
MVVQIAGRAGPDGEEIVGQLGNRAADTSNADAAAKAEDALATGVNQTTLYPVAFLGGVAGWALLEALASRLSLLFEVVVHQSRKWVPLLRRERSKKRAPRFP